MPLLFALLLAVDPLPARPAATPPAPTPPAAAVLSDVQCAAITLDASPARSVRLQASELTSVRGPVVYLMLGVAAEEGQRLGPGGFIRIGGQAFAGGRFSLVLDERNQMELMLAFDPDQLDRLSRGLVLELVRPDGSKQSMTLAAADPSSLRHCIDASAPPTPVAIDPLFRRNWTFVPLGPDQPLRIRSRRNPDSFYPRTALSEQREGVSRVQLVIGTNGHVDACEIVTSSGHADLDDASCRAARTSAYLPATDARGEPLETTMFQNLVWKTSR